MLKYNKKLKPLARGLRKNMTDAERLLWNKIRMKQMRGYQFYRQKTIGNYIVDFYCPKAKLALEVDGGQHYSDEQVEVDKKRSTYLNKLRVKVIRFTNLDVLKNIDVVLDEIFRHLKSPCILLVFFSPLFCSPL